MSAQIQITHVIVHTPEQVQGILEEAQRITGDMGLEGAEAAVAFVEAVRLLGQRFTVAAPAQPVDLSQLRNGPRMDIPRGRG